MSYKVELTESAEEKIVGWHLAEETRLALLLAIQRDLETLDRLNGFRSVAPIIFHTHRVVFHCPETGERLKYLLWIDDRHSRKDTRIVLDLSPIDSIVPYAGLTKREASNVRHGDNDGDWFIENRD